MERISVQNLKAQLSAVLERARGGSTVLVTRHSEAVAQIGPARPAHVHRGAQTGTGRLEPALRRSGTRGRYLTVLHDDRGGR